MDFVNLLKRVDTPFIDSQTLIRLLDDYKRPREAILRLVKNNVLIRLKNGFFLINDKISEGSEKVIPFEQVANLLYGPSYVSMEWALSFYGMIPERVHTVTSMTLGKNKSYCTPIGDFSYFYLPPKCYSVGVTQKESSDFVGGFLMASPEKALADMVYKTCSHMDKKQLKEELLESKRINREMLQDLNVELLEEIALSYSANSVNHLTNLLGTI